MNKTRDVYLPAAPEDENLVSGRFPPQRIRNESTDSVNILIRSEDRSHGNDFDFQSDLIASSAHIRKIQLSKAIVPLCPQINEHNKSVTITHSTGTVTFDLIPGFYSCQSLANMMQQQFLVAWQSLLVTNSVSVSYDIDRRSIVINDDLGALWYLHTGCPFDVYARNVVKFPSKVAGSPVTSRLTESLSLGMIYSRFYILTSSRLTEDQKSFSMISGRGPSNILSIIDVASAYNVSQFAVSISFPGTEFSIDTISYAPKINILNRNKSLRILDLQLEDEFSFNLSTIDTTEMPFEYSTAFFFQGYL